MSSVGVAHEGARLRRIALGVLCVLVGAGACTALSIPAAVAAEACPNEQFRVGPGANLPDCRAYEQVSPVDKDNYDILFGNQGVTAGGDAVTYQSFGSFAGSPANGILNQYTAFRTATGWSTQAITPPEPSLPASESGELFFEGFSPDLSETVLRGGSQDGGTPGTVNLFRRDADGSLHLLSIGEPSGEPNGLPDLAGASADFTHILVEDSNALTPDAQADQFQKLYEWVNGALTLISKLPNGTPIDGQAGSGIHGNGTTSHAISDDGSRVFWTAGVLAPSQIYLRQGGTSSEITAPQCTTNPRCPSGSGSGTYWTASTDGSRAFLTSNLQLTDDSTASFADNGDLYQYDVNTRRLTDLTVDPAEPGGADVLGVVGASDDGSYLYFVANGALAAGATAGQPNLYLAHAGTTTFIATLDPNNDGSDWTLGTPWQRSTRAQVSADGLHLLFTTVARQSGYDNQGHSEVYVYDASHASLTCASCNPAGVPAAADAVPSFPTAVGVGAQAQLTALNNMTPDGSRVFFETSDALVPQDVNGVQDVYEWEADGVGTCQDPAGCVALISSGHSDSPSNFDDATPSGNDVLFLTREQLVGQDIDADVDLYDARVSGGFPPPPLARPVCTGDGCLGQPETGPITPVAASLSFAGPGNLAPPVTAKQRLTRAQKLAKALRACRKKSKRQRKRCQSEARRRFGRGGASRVKGAK